MGSLNLSCPNYCSLDIRVLDGELLYTKILEVNLFAFACRLFYRDFSPIDGTFKTCTCTLNNDTCPWLQMQFLGLLNKYGGLILSGQSGFISIKSQHFQLWIFSSISDIIRKYTETSSDIWLIQQDSTIHVLTCHLRD